jgi:hypothetical protein
MYQKSAALVFALSSLILMGVVSQKTFAASPPAIGPCCLPRSLTFSSTSKGTHQYTAGFTGHKVFSLLVAANGSGSAGENTDPVQTEVPLATHLEALVAETNGKPFVASCSSPTYTGSPSTDLACYIAATRAQGFPYAVGAP